MKNRIFIMSLLLCICQSPGAEDVFDCIVTPSKITDVTAATSGRLAKVLVDRSDEVQAGMVIAELDAEVERAGLAVAAARAAMTAEMHLGKINYAFGNQRKERLESLHLNKVASNQDLDDATRDAALAAWNLQQARDVHQLRILEKARSQAQLRQKTVTSPISGVVLQRFKNTGEYVEDQAIVRIAQLDPLYVETIVPISLFGQIEKGSTSEITLNTGDAAKYVATVNAVDRTGDAAAGTFGVRLELPNPGSEIPAGIKCLVNFAGQTPAQANNAASDSMPGAPLAAFESNK